MEISDDSITVLPYSGSLNPVDNHATLPGFPTDLQAQMCNVGN